MYNPIHQNHHLVNKVIIFLMIHKLYFHHLQQPLFHVEKNLLLYYHYI